MITNRQPSDTFFLELASLLARQSTCPRGNVGCVLTNKRKHIIGTGYNGVPPGYPHCKYGNPCSLSLDSESCKATHAEQNALLQCRDVYEIETIYTTLEPCFFCAKLIANTSCKRIVCLEEYRDKTGIEFLASIGITTVGYFPAS